MGPLQGSISALTITVVATAAVASKQLVGFDGAPAGAGEAVLGVAQTDAAVGDAFAVDVIGVFDLVSGAAVPAGSAVQSDANSKPIVRPEPEEDDTDDQKAAKAALVQVGTALTAATNPGDLVKILIK